MGIFNFIKKNKIIPKRSDILEKEAKNLAKRVLSSREAYLILSNREVGTFISTFQDECKRILEDRKENLEYELECLKISINKIQKP